MPASLVLRLLLRQTSVARCRIDTARQKIQALPDWYLYIDALPIHKHICCCIV